jgi:hypothetical protein
MFTYMAKLIFLGRIYVGTPMSVKCNKCPFTTNMRRSRVMVTLVTQVGIIPYYNTPKAYIFIKTPLQ